MTARDSRAVHLTLEPDGEAAACKAVEVGSIPTGVSDQPTAGSDYIFQMKHLNHYLVGRSLIFVQLPVGST